MRVFELKDGSTWCPDCALLYLDTSSTFSSGEWKTSTSYKCVKCGKKVKGEYIKT